MPTSDRLRASFDEAYTIFDLIFALSGDLNVRDESCEAGRLRIGKRDKGGTAQSVSRLSVSRNTL